MPPKCMAVQHQEHFVCVASWSYCTEITSDKLHHLLEVLEFLKPFFRCRYTLNHSTYIYRYFCLESIITESRYNEVRTCNSVSAATSFIPGTYEIEYENLISRIQKSKPLESYG